MRCRKSFAASGSFNPPNGTLTTWPIDCDSRKNQRKFHWNPKNGGSFVVAYKAVLEDGGFPYIGSYRLLTTILGTWNAWWFVTSGPINPVVDDFLVSHSSPKRIVSRFQPFSVSVLGSLQRWIFIDSYYESSYDFLQIKAICSIRNVLLVVRIPTIQTPHCLWGWCFRSAFPVASDATKFQSFTSHLFSSTNQGSFFFSLEPPPPPPSNFTPLEVENSEFTPEIMMGLFKTSLSCLSFGKNFEGRSVFHFQGVVFATLLSRGPPPSLGLKNGRWAPVTRPKCATDTSDFWKIGT